MCFHCHKEEREERILQTYWYGTRKVCKECFDKEMVWRKEMNNKSSTGNRKLEVIDWENWKNQTSHSYGS